MEAFIAYSICNSQVLFRIPACKAKRRERMEKEENGEQAQSSAGDSVHETYVIRPGDTIYQISIEKYGSMDKIQEICELNGISQEEIIYPGQIIILP